MVAFAKTSAHDAVMTLWAEQFVQMFPQIRHQASVALQSVGPKQRKALIALVIENALGLFLQLAERGKADIAYPKPLAISALRQLHGGNHLPTTGWF